MFFSFVLICSDKPSSIWFQYGIMVSLPAFTPINFQCRYSCHAIGNIPPITNYISIPGTRTMTEIVLSHNLYTSSLCFADHCRRSHVKCLVSMDERAQKKAFKYSLQNSSKCVSKLKKWVPNISLGGSFHSWVKLHSVLASQPRAAWDGEGNPAWQAPGCQRAGNLALQLLATKRPLEGIWVIADQKVCHPSLLMVVGPKKIKSL